MASKVKRAQLKLAVHSQSIVQPPQIEPPVNRFERWIHLHGVSSTQNRRFKPDSPVKKIESTQGTARATVSPRSLASNVDAPIFIAPQINRRQP
jgi:hypothetical protein